jgi:L-iditol 2-dehydrogenase
MGFEYTFNAQLGDPVTWVKEQTEGRGADLVVEAAGVPDTFIQSILMARKNGRITVMGNPAADVTLTPETISQLLRKQVTISGSWNSRFTELPVNEWKLVLKMVAQERLHLLPLITHEAKLSEVNEILPMMRDKEQFYNKVMFVNEE